MLQPLFGLIPPDWTEKGPDQGMLALLASKAGGADEDDLGDELADIDEDAEEADEENSGE
jgi:hypothetical protein